LEKMQTEGKDKDNVTEFEISKEHEIIGGYCQIVKVAV
jgi:hypothetical protein